MNINYFSSLLRNNFLFWLSRKIDYPLVAPDTVQVNFTFRCNLSCKMCSMNSQMKLLRSQGKPVEIDTPTFKKILREAKEMGVKTALFIGGEPFLREDLFELTAYAKELSFNVVIVTNGVLLNEENIRRCIRGGVDWLSVSLDAADPQAFARIRGQGVLEKIKANLKLLNRIKREEEQQAPQVVSVCTIMNDNLEELSGVLALCRELEISRVIFQPVVFNNADQADRSFNAKDFIGSDRGRIMEKAIDELIGFKQESRENFRYVANSVSQLKRMKRYFKGELNRKKLPCYAGYNRLQITQDYVVYFCIPPVKGVSSSFGNVAEDNLKDLWFGAQARLRRKLIRQCRTPCLQWCSYRDEFVAVSDLFHERILFGPDGKRRRRKTEK